MNRLTAIIIFFSALLLFSQSVWSGGTLAPNTGEVRPGLTNTQIEDDGNITVDSLSPDGSLKYYDSRAEQKPMTAEHLDRLIIKNPEKDARIATDADLQNQVDNIQIGASGGLKLYDANNQFLGFLMSYDGGNGLKEFDAKVYNPTFGGIIEWYQRYSEQDGIKFRLRNDGQQLFSNADCTGLTYADVGCCGMGTIKTLREFYGSKEFFIVTDGPFWVSSDDIKSRTSHDVNDQVYCEPIHYNDTQIELYEYTIVEAPFSFPVTNPVRIGL